jgi:cell division protein FtsL
MNRKQQIVLWVTAIILSITSAYHGVQEESLFYGVAVPVLILGTVLTIQLRDRRPQGNSRDAPSSDRRNALVIALLLMNGLLVYQTQMQEETERSVGSMESSVSDLESSLSGLQSTVSDLSKDVSALDLSGTLGAVRPSSDIADIRRELSSLQISMLGLESSIRRNCARN